MHGNQVINVIENHYGVDMVNHHQKQLVQKQERDGKNGKHSEKLASMKLMR